MCDKFVTVTYDIILYFNPKFKIEKKNKNTKKIKIKTKFTILNFDNYYCSLLLNLI